MGTGNGDAQSQQLEPGARVGRYVVVEKLGAGGMGEVYRARDETLERDVALKVLPATMTDDGEARLRLLREARAAARVRHPNLVAVHDAGTTEAHEVYVVMELVEGMTLRAVVAEESLTTADAADVVLQLAGALEAVHAAGLVHRDVKPENVMWRGDGTVALLDFGLARPDRSHEPPDGESATEEAYALTQTGAVVGTPAYLAPEQARGKPEAASDQFALAVLAYELLAGHRPWRARESVALLAAILTDPPPALPARYAAHEAVLMRALAKDPSERYPSVRAFGEAFSSAGGGEALPAPADFGTADTVATPGGSVEALPSTRRHEEPPKGRLWMVFALAAALIAGGALLVADLGEEPPAVEEPAASPGADTVIACPIFEVEGAGPWLGAAAASLSCERLRWMRGGSPTRTRIPAELLGLPRTPRDDFPEAPFEGDARERSLAAIDAGELTLDGSVEVLADGLRVILRPPTGEWVGEGPGLFDAVVEAMAEADESWWNDEVDEAVSVAPTTREGLALFDVYVERSGPRCRVLEDLPPEVGPTLAALAAECDWAGSERAPTALEGLQEDVATQLALGTEEGFASLLERLAAVDAPFGRTLEAVLLLRQGELRSAEQRALASLDQDPRQRQAWLALRESRFVGRRGPSNLAATAWIPWNAHSWIQRGRSTGDPEARVKASERAFMLAPEPTIGGVYAEALIEVGRVEEARLVASRLRGLGDPAAEAWARTVELRVDASEGELGAVFERALTILSESSHIGDETSHVAYLAREIGALLGRETEVADLMVQRFVLAPSAAERLGVNSWGGALGSLHCALASEELRAPCFAAVDTIAEANPLIMQLPGSEHFVEGHRRASVGDFEGAAASYRRVAQRDSVPVIRQALVMAPALDAAGEHELAERVDEWLLAHPGELGGANNATVRAARRALARGDEAEAREHATKVIDAWLDADVEVPAVDEMRELLASLES